VVSLFGSKMGPDTPQSSLSKLRVWRTEVDVEAGGLDLRVEVSMKL